MNKVFDKKTAFDKESKIENNLAVSSPFKESDANFADGRNILRKKEIEIIKSDLSDAIAKQDAREIFDYFNIGFFIKKDGTYGISEYRQPSNNITYAHLGIDENKLIENVTKISGNADFRNSSLKHLAQIRHIGGRTDFRESFFNINTKLPKIDGKIIFYKNQTLLQDILIKLYTFIKQSIIK